jgi:ATP-dependent RNA helicase SUPV3L1/SUV3
MFQAGEVDCLVATDAIGMGLNLGVEHVAFAATRKFDGRDVRDVDDAELAQIAGRAGRWIHDGTFGTLTPLELPVSTVAAIESHAFPQVRRVQWRSCDLAFDSIAELRASLMAAPKRSPGLLRHAAGAEDAAVLALLAGREEIASRATAPDRVRLLWDVCSIPDFKKLLLEVHADFLAELYIELVDRGRLRDPWIDAHVRELERGASATDVDELVARIASTRTWTYVANRTPWLESNDGRWEARTRRLEDSLSDALHERLVLRFVDVRKASRSSGPRARRPRQPTANAVDEMPVSVPAGHPFAALQALRTRLAPNAPVRGRGDKPGAPAWIEEVVDAPHASFVLDDAGQIRERASSRALGRVVRGASIALPDVRIATNEELGGGARSRLLRRLLAFARDLVSDLLGGATALATPQASPATRAFVHRLEQGLGSVLAADIDDVLAALNPAAQAALAAAGVQLGHGAVWLPRGLAADAVTARIALATAWFECGRALRALRAPERGAVSFVPSRGLPRAALAAIGYPVVGPRAIRVDVLDRLVTELDAGPPDEPKLASWIGATTPELRKVLRQLGRS